MEYNEEKVIELNNEVEVLETNNIQLSSIEPLKLSNEYCLTYREIDNFIDVTNLCKAAGKKLNDWRRIDRSISFINTLSLVAGIPAARLLCYKNNGNNSRVTWAHPQVAINIAQWISPEFDVQVSNWIFEIMITGKVDINNSKTTQELDQLRLECNKQALKIKTMTNRYVKKQARIQYEDKWIIYMVINDALVLKGQVKIGKTMNLTERLSQYNTSCLHTVLFQRSCKDEENMDIIDKMIDKKLRHCKVQANREHFIGNPDDLKIIINKCIESVLD